MQVICTDGTRFSCHSYEVIERGVKLYSVDVEDADDPSHRYKPDSDEFQVGYVPDAALRYILPDGVQPVGLPAPPVAQGGQPPGGR